MIYRVDVSTRRGARDARGESILPQIEALGIDGVQSVSVTSLYFLQGDLDGQAVQRIVDTLLHDPVVEEAVWH
ncbi:MAG: phosphoribosylformylglycinamidine synthase subunit PurS, partial [Anaerolineae bacterium]|nr:phosphoribosylformylglycinamidine synthase subunit PurS [Anaerolineae bacterium]